MGITAGVTTGIETNYHFVTPRGMETELEAGRHWEDVLVLHVVTAKENGGDGDWSGGGGGGEAREGGSSPRLGAQIVQLARTEFRIQPRHS